MRRTMFTKTNVRHPIFRLHHFMVKSIDGTVFVESLVGIPHFPGYPGKFWVLSRNLLVLNNLVKLQKFTLSITLNSWKFLLVTLLSNFSGTSVMYSSSIPTKTVSLEVQAQRRFSWLSQFLVANFSLFLKLAISKIVWSIFKTEFVIF